MEMKTKMVTDLVATLENATLMAKQLPSVAATAGDSATIYASLHAAHRHLSLFLASSQPSADNNDGDDAPMQFTDDVVDGDGAAAAEEEDSKMATIDAVEERMRDWSIQKNKRLKRSLSPPSFAAGERRRWLDYEIESARARVDYDPHVTKLRALDLIYQFHC